MQISAILKCGNFSFHFCHGCTCTVIALCCYESYSFPIQHLQKTHLTYLPKGHKCALLQFNWKYNFGQNWHTLIDSKIFMHQQFSLTVVLVEKRNWVNHGVHVDFWDNMRGEERGGEVGKEKYFGKLICVFIERTRNT